MAKAENWLVQEVRQGVEYDPTAEPGMRNLPAGIMREETYETKDEAEKIAREIRAGGHISYLWKLEWFTDHRGREYRLRLNGETFIPWREFAEKD